MKKLLLIVLALQTLNVLASCKYELTNKVASDYMGHYEISDLFNNRGYFKPYYKDDVADIKIKFSMVIPYVCSQSSYTILDEISKPLNRMKMIVTDSEGETATYETGMRFYYLGKNSERRAIKKLIRKLPKCE